MDSVSAPFPARSVPDVLPDIQNSISRRKHKSQSQEIVGIVQLSELRCPS